MDIDWSALNTALIIAAIAYLYRQARIVDQVKQAILGTNGHTGALVEVRDLREKVEDLNESIGKLNTSVAVLTQRMDYLGSR